MSQGSKGAGMGPPGQGKKRNSGAGGSKAAKAQKTEAKQVKQKVPENFRDCYPQLAIFNDWWRGAQSVVSDLVCCS